MAKHKNTEILSILEEARTAARETDPNFRSAALIEVAKAYESLIGTNGSGFFNVDSEEKS